MNKATDLETAILHFLCDRLAGHSVSILRGGIGRFTGFSVGNGRSIAISDLIELFNQHQPAPATTPNVMQSEDRIDAVVSAVRQALMDAAHAHCGERSVASGIIKAEVYATNAIRVALAAPAHVAVSAIVRDGISAALVALKLAANLPGIAKEYDFSDAIAATEAAWLAVKDAVPTSVSQGAELSADHFRDVTKMISAPAPAPREIKSMHPNGDRLDD